MKDIEDLSKACVGVRRTNILLFFCMSTLMFGSDDLRSDTLIEAHRAATFIKGFQKTCTAYNQSGSISFNFTSFSYSPEAGEVTVGIIIKSDRTGQGFGTLTQTSLAELDPSPSFEEFTRGKSTVPIVKFNCAKGACARNVGGAGVGTIGYIMLPGCSGSQKLANAFSQLISAHGGEPSPY